MSSYGKQLTKSDYESKSAQISRVRNRPPSRHHVPLLSTHSARLNIPTVIANNIHDKNLLWNVTYCSYRDQNYTNWISYFVWFRWSHLKCLYHASNALKNTNYPHTSPPFLNLDLAPTLLWRGGTIRYWAVCGVGWSNQYIDCMSYRH